MPGRVGTHHTIYAGCDGRSSYINLWGGWVGTHMIHQPVKIIIHQHVGLVGDHHTSTWGVGWGHIIYQPAGGGVKDHHTSTYGGVLGDHHTSTFAGRGEDTSYIKDGISFLMLQLWHWAKPRTPLPLISEFQRMFPLWNLRMFMQGFFPARLLQSGCFFMLYWLLDHLPIERVMWVRIMDGWYQGIFFAIQSPSSQSNLLLLCT